MKMMATQDKEHRPSMRITDINTEVYGMILDELK